MVQDLGDLVSDFIGDISKYDGGTDDLRDAWRDRQISGSKNLTCCECRTL